MKTPKTTEEMIEEWDELIKVSTKLELRQWLQSTLTQLANSIHEQSALEAEGRKKEEWEPVLCECGHEKGSKRNMENTLYNQALTDLAEYHRSKVIE